MGEQTDVKQILRRVFLATALLEGIGILVLWVRFLFESRSILDALWHATFHSVSAFCNAGFALHDDSLISYQTDPVVNIVIAALIVLGGIGFPVLLDVYSGCSWRKPFDWEGLHIHSKSNAAGNGRFDPRRLHSSPGD